jgi:hypothetical protein
MDKVNAPAMERWKHGVDLYKSEIRPMLPTCRVFHHTPVQDYQENGAWVVLEYADWNSLAAVVGIFRLQGGVSDSFRVAPKGLDPARNYRVRFDGSGRDMIIPGRELCATGLSIRVPAAMMSELLIIKAV